MNDADKGGDASPDGVALPYGVAPPFYRLPAATGLGRVRLEVADLERSLDWYGSVLGLRTGDRTGSRAVLGVGERGGSLVELNERPGASPVPPRGRPGLYHYALLVPDRVALGRFASHLRRLGVRAGASDHRVSEALYLDDPDGLGIEVYADRPRSAWGREGRQLVMGTDPLDLGDLIRAAEAEGQGQGQGQGQGDNWGGLPAGTVVGHVHLHVGDLARAEAFYHEGLGLDKVVWSYPGALFLSAGGYHHHLGVNTWAAHATPAGEGDARLLEWELVVPSAADAVAAVGSLEAAGHPVERDPVGGVARDPWGTAVRIRPGGPA